MAHVRFTIEIQGWFNINLIAIINYNNRMKEKKKEKNPHEISIDSGKKLTKYNTLMVKTLNKLGIEGNYLNIIKPYMKSLL